MVAITYFGNYYLSYGPFLLGLMLLGLLALILKSSAFKGWWGERHIRLALRRLDPERYKCFHDLYLPRPDGEGTTQIDHVVVSLNGIFVIETKHYQGWIFGCENQKHWTQQIYRKKFRFPNPLHQNDLHLRALATHLALPRDRFYSLICFTGDATFKTPMPNNVLIGGFAAWIQSHQTPSLTPPELSRVLESLVALDRFTDRKSAAKLHHKSMRARPSRR